MGQVKRGSTFFIFGVIFLVIFSAFYSFALADNPAVLQFTDANGNVITGSDGQYVSTLDFGKTDIGSTRYRVIKVQYVSGTMPATFAAASPHNSPSSFSFIGGQYPGTYGTCGTSINSDCTMAISFTPQKENKDSQNSSPGELEYDNAINFQYNDGETLQERNLVFAGKSPEPPNPVQLMYQAPSYGTALVGSRVSRSFTLWLKNANTAVHNISWDSPLARSPVAPFELAESCSGDLVSPNQCTVRIIYHPTVPGPSEQTATFSYNDGVSTKTISIPLKAEAFFPDASNNVLVVYNEKSEHSVKIKDYYLGNSAKNIPMHRPGFENVNTLELSFLTAADQYPLNNPDVDGEFISRDQFEEKILRPITDWIYAHPEKEIKYIILLPGIPDTVGLYGEEWSSGIQHMISQGGLVGGWDMSGMFRGSNTLGDSTSYNKENGNLVNNPEYVSQGEAFALNFNGNNSVIIPDSANSSSLLNVNAKLSVLAWINLAIKQEQAIFAKWDDDSSNDNAYKLGLFGPNPMPTFSIQQADGAIISISSTVDLPVNAWSSLAGVADGTYLHLYVNGQEAATPVPYNGTINVSSRVATIGTLRANDNFRGFNGMMTGVSVFQRPLLAREIVNMSQKGKPVVYPTGAYSGGSGGYFNNRDYPGTMALVTKLNMGSLSNETSQVYTDFASADNTVVESTEAYIDKLNAMYLRDTSKSKLPVITSYGTEASGSTYYLEDTGTYSRDKDGNVVRDKDGNVVRTYGDLALVIKNDLLANNPNASVDYRPWDGPYITNASDVKGLQTWGMHGYRNGDYSRNGHDFTFSGNSGWYLMETFESFNGAWITGPSGGHDMGNFIDWFSKNAFGGKYYEYTPIGAVCYVNEPGLEITSSEYFTAWEEGQLFADCAWKSKGSRNMMAVGDPLVSSGELETLYGDVSGDGKVTAYDSALTAQAAVGLITFTSSQVQAGDVDGNGSITAYDAALIAQYAVGAINKFPVEGG